MKKEKTYEDGEYSPDKECRVCKERGIKEKRITAYNKKYDTFLCSEHDYFIEDIMKGQK